MKCGAHTEEETTLRCGKCGKLICPRCMVETPVGAHCTGCAGLRRLPIYVVSPVYYVKGFASGLGMALVGGFVWGIIGRTVPFIYLDLVLASALGYAVGEVMSLAVNRKRGTGLAVAAGLCMAIGFATNLLFSGLPFGFMGIGLHIISLVLGIFMAVRRFR